MRERSDFKHIWWSCEKLQVFWKKLYKEIRWELRICLEFIPESCLLHLNLGKEDCILVNSLLIEVRFLIIQK